MKLSHVFLYVTDQDEARDWYTNKLGLELCEDMTMDDVGMRWLTVSPRAQPELQITLMQPGPPAVSEEAGEQLAALLSQGALAGCIFQTDDCRKAYDELSARGVEFTQAPDERFYGVDAGFRDPFGNQFRLVQPSGFTTRDGAASPSGAGA